MRFLVEAVSSELHAASTIQQCPNPPIRLLTRRELCTFLQIHPETCRRWTHSGRLIAAPLTGQCARYDTSEVDRLLQEARIGPKKPGPKPKSPNPIAPETAAAFFVLRAHAQSLPVNLPFPEPPASRHGASPHMSLKQAAEYVGVSERTLWGEQQYLAAVLHGFFH